MSLTGTLKEDVKAAMKAGDAFSLGVLRMVIAALHNKSIEKRGNGLNEELTHEETLALLQQEAKRRVEAAALYEKGGRKDLADQERKEAAFIQKYLPVPMSREEITHIVDKIISAARARNSDVAFASIIKEVMKELKGRADGKLVGQIIKEKLQTTLSS